MRKYFVKLENNHYLLPGQKGHGYTWNELAGIIDTKVKGHFEVDLPLGAKESSANEVKLLALHGDLLAEKIWPRDPRQ